MSERERRDQRMIGDPAPRSDLTEAERRALLERLRRLRRSDTPQESRVEWLDRGVEGQRGTEPRQTPTPPLPRRRPSRQSGPPQARTDPSYIPPRPTISPGERREIIERLRPPQPSGGVIWQQPTVTPNPVDSLDERLQEQQREIEELRRQYARGTQDRGTSERGTGTVSESPLRVDLSPEGRERAMDSFLQSQPQELPNDLATLPSRLHRGPIPVRPDYAWERWFSGDDAALEPYRPQLEQMESQLDRSGLPGNVAGIGLGVVRSIREIFAGLVNLMRLITEFPWDTIRGANRADFEELVATLRDLLDAEIEDQAVTRALAEAIWGPILRIGERFREAIRLAEEGHQVRSSAEITQATVEVIALLSAVEENLAAVRRIPQTVRQHLRRLSSLRRRFRVFVERSRRRIADSGVGRFARDLIDDEQGSLDPNALLRGAATRPDDEARGTSSESRSTESTAIVPYLSAGSHSRLQEIAATGLTSTQINTLERLLNHSLTSSHLHIFNRLWRQTRSSYVSRIREIQDMFESARPRSEISRRARDLFGEIREDFWDAVANNPEAVQILQRAGIQISPGGGSPRIRMRTLEGIRDVTIDIDHDLELGQFTMDSFSPGNLRFTLQGENRILLNQIISQDPFQEHARLRSGRGRSRAFRLRGPRQSSQ